MDLKQALRDACECLLDEDDRYTVASDILADLETRSEQGLKDDATWLLFLGTIDRTDREPINRLAAFVE